jgi:hypothetical protein
LLLEPLEAKEILLRVIPTKEGDFVLKKIEWELFEVVKCSRELTGLSVVNSQGKKIGGEMSLKFKAIEESGECETQLVVKGQEIDKDRRIIFSECKKCIFRVKNLSKKFKIKNAYVTCSHPLLFNFENQKITEYLEEGSSFDLPMDMKVNLIGPIIVKFLVRYEVDSPGGPSSKFRFLRHTINLKSE